MITLFSIILMIAFVGISISKSNYGPSAIVGAIVAIIFGFINYFAIPTMAIWNMGLWTEVFIVLLLGVIAASVWEDDHILIRGIVLGGYVIIWILVGVFSAPMTNAYAYNQMLDVEEVEFNSFGEDINVIPVDKMVSVDYDLARKVVEDRIEGEPGLGSRCTVGRMTLQNLTAEFEINEGVKLSFENEQVWVAPLEHTSFWKWNKSKTTMGYMLVYASDAKQTFLVTKVNGKDLKLRYLESGCFGDDIERHIRQNNYASQGLTEHNFEISPDGRPYWVLCNYEPTIGMKGYEAKGVITVDIQTGDVEQYSIEDAPAWVDHIQPEEFVYNQIYYWGSLKDGWWNSWVAQTNVQVPTPGMVLVYSEGESYWYTGIQSAGGDSATSGFMLVNSRTKEAKYYKVPGMNELEAKRIAEDQDYAKANRYYATSPVLYNVRNKPTYFMTYKSESGNVAGYAFVAVENREAVGTGKYKSDAERAYLQALLRLKVDKVSEGQVIETSYTYTVRDITSEGNVYYILFNEVEGKEFSGSSEIFRELRWTKPNHKVKVSYGDGSSEIVPLDNFENLDFEF